jgi:SagB-type dehydrogenase family enzyme
MAAAAMLRAVRQDPQLHLPERPRFVPGLVVAPLPGGLVIEGTAERQVFRGAAATDLLPRLLPLLDGHRSLPELAAAVGGITEDKLAAVIALLYSRGLLEDGADPAAPADTAPTTANATVGYLARHLDTTRVHRSTGALLADMTAARLAVTGPAEACGQLIATLAGCGIKAAHVDDVDALLAAEPTLVVALADEPEDTTALRELDVSLHSPALPWLRVARRGAVVELGPQFQARRSACYECFLAARPGERITGGTVSTTAWTALAATEILHIVARIGTRHSRGGTGVVDLARWTTDNRPLVRRAGCACGTEQPGPGEAAQGLPLAYTYHQAVVSKSRDSVDPKNHQAHYTTAAAKLQHAYKSYPAAPKTPLPIGPIPCTSAGDITVLAALVRGSLGLMDGPNGPRSRRCAPTGGNLGSPQGYLIAVNVPGLQAGIHFYEPFTDTLSLLQTFNSAGEGRAVVNAAGLVAPGAPQPDAVVVLTAGLDRIAGKYADFALHLAFLDAGVAREQLCLLAHSLGNPLSVIVCEQWDDHTLAHTLGIDRLTEPIACAVLLSRPAHCAAPSQERP